MIQENFPELKKNDMKLDIERSYCILETILTQNDQHKTYCSEATGLWTIGKKSFGYPALGRGVTYKGKTIILTSHFFYSNALNQKKVE